MIASRLIDAADISPPVQFSGTRWLVSICFAEMREVRPQIDALVAGRLHDEHPPPVLEHVVQPPSPAPQSGLPQPCSSGPSGSGWARFASRISMPKVRDASSAT